MIQAIYICSFYKFWLHNMQCNMWRGIKKTSNPKNSTAPRHINCIYSYFSQSCRSLFLSWLIRASCIIFYPSDITSQPWQMNIQLLESSIKHLTFQAIWLKSAVQYTLPFIAEAYIEQLISIRLHLNRFVIVFEKREPCKIWFSLFFKVR